MGNTEQWLSWRQFESEEALLKDLIPIDDGENHNDMLAMGRFKIYRFRTEPYEMVLKHVRVFPADHPGFREQAQVAKELAREVSHKNIARIHCVNLCSKSQLCLKQASIETYANYYAIHLEQLIEQRKQVDIRLTSGEAWYLLNSLVDAAAYLEELGIYFGVFLSRNISLSSEGYVKLYLYHLTPNHRHLLYQHLLGNTPRDAHKYLPVAPECLALLRARAHSLGPLDKGKMEVFGVGMVVLEAMLLHSPRRYFQSTSSNDYPSSFDQDQLQRDLDELSSIYPPQLTQLLTKMTSLCPSERPSLGEVRQQIASMREGIAMAGSLRMVEDEENPIEPKVSYHSGQVGQPTQDILRSITNHHKLHCAPVTSLNQEKVQSCRQSRRQPAPLAVSLARRKENKLHISAATALSLSRPTPASSFR